VRAIASSQLLADVLEVRLHCFFGDQQALGDISVSISRCE